MPDALFKRTKTLAQKRHVPMRELITEGLLHVLDQKESETPRQIKPVTFKGEGISPEFSKASWSTLRDDDPWCTDRRLMSRSRHPDLLDGRS